MAASSGLSVLARFAWGYRTPPAVRAPLGRAPGQETSIVQRPTSCARCLGQRDRPDGLLDRGPDASDGRAHRLPERRPPGWHHLPRAVAAWRPADRIGRPRTRGKTPTDPTRRPQRSGPAPPRRGRCLPAGRDQAPSAQGLPAPVPPVGVQSGPIAPVRGLREPLIGPQIAQFTFAGDGRAQVGAFHPQSTRPAAEGPSRCAWVAHTASG